MRGVAALCVYSSLASVTCAEAVFPNNSTCPPRNRCEFGKLPGYWREDEWPQWQVVDACCRLKDLVGRSLSSPATFSHDEGVRARILIFGDSVDRITLHDLCGFAIPRTECNTPECSNYMLPSLQYQLSTASQAMHLYIYLVHK